MIINTAELEKALTIVKPGLAAKELIEQSTSFAFVNNCVVTYNDEISITHPIKGLQLEGAIRADELYQFLNKIKKDEIDIEITGNEILFSAGRTKAGFAFQSEITLPLEEIGKHGKWGNLPEDFSHYLSLAMGAAGRDMSQPILTCVYVEKEGTILASDGFKIIKCDTGEEMPVDNFLIPATSAVDIIKLKPTEVASGKGWVHFRNEKKTIISCRVFIDDYPDPSAVLDVDGIEITFPSTIGDKLELAAVFAKKDHILDEAIKIKIGANRIEISAKSETGWVSDEANIRYADEPVEFDITYYLLKDILKETHNFLLGEKVLKFEGAGWVYISALRNVK